MRDTGLIDEWLQWSEINKGMATSTMGKYRQAALRLKEYLHKNDATFETASADQIELWAGLVLFKDYKLTAPARKPLIAAVKNLYRYLERRSDKRFQQSPAALLQAPRVGRTCGTKLQLHNLERILQQPDLNTWEGARDLAMLMMLAGTGLRVDTLAKLNTSNIRRTEYKGADRYLIKTRTKGQTEIEVPLPLEAQVALQFYLAHAETQEIDREILVNEYADSVLFVTRGNRMVKKAAYHGEARRISSKTIDDRIKIYAEKAGIPNVESHAHAFRHLFGTEMAEDDATPFEIQALMGHADIRSSQVYIHMATRKKTERSDISNPLGKVSTPMSDMAKQFFTPPTPT